MMPLNVKIPLSEPFVRSVSAFSKVLSSIAVKPSAKSERK